MLTYISFQGLHSKTYDPDLVHDDENSLLVRLQEKHRMIQQNQEWVQHKLGTSRPATPNPSRRQMGNGDVIRRSSLPDSDSPQVRRNENIVLQEETPAERARRLTRTLPAKRHRGSVTSEVDVFFGRDAPLKSSEETIPSGEKENQTIETVPTLELVNPTEDGSSSEDSFSTASNHSSGPPHVEPYFIYQSTEFLAGTGNSPLVVDYGNAPFYTYGSPILSGRSSIISNESTSTEHSVSTDLPSQPRTDDDARSATISRTSNVQTEPLFMMEPPKPEGSVARSASLTRNRGIKLEPFYVNQAFQLEPEEKVFKHRDSLSLKRRSSPRMSRRSGSEDTEGDPDQLPPEDIPEVPDEDASPGDPTGVAPETSPQPGPSSTLDDPSGSTQTSTASVDRNLPSMEETVVSVDQPSPDETQVTLEEEPAALEESAVAPYSTIPMVNVIGPEEDTTVVDIEPLSSKNEGTEPSVESDEEDEDSEPEIIITRF